MNEIELLKADHKIVADLFKQVEAGKESEHPAIFKKIKVELDVHAHIEEVVFYPKLKADGNKELVDIVLEGIEEHRQAKMFLKEIAALVDDSEKFEPKLKVLIEDVEQHVKEEEEEMFPAAQKEFSKSLANELGEKFDRRKPAELEVAEANDNGSDKE